MTPKIQMLHNAASPTEGVDGRNRLRVNK